jgi:hypothetical protein
MVVNFRARGISRGARKLARTPTLIKIKSNYLYNNNDVHARKEKKKLKGVVW